MMGNLFRNYKGSRTDLQSFQMKIDIRGLRVKESHE